MRQVWLVEGGEYSDRYTDAVCSSEEQANGVAVMRGLYVDGPVEMWEPDDEVPPFKLLHQCIVREGSDSTHPVAVEHDTRPVAVDFVGDPRVTVSGYYWRWWARANGYPTAAEAEAAARDAYETRRPTPPS